VERKDGQRILVRLSAARCGDPAGPIECFETIAEDVTERRALEAQLRQAQKMEAIGQLTGGIRTTSQPPHHHPGERRSSSPRRFPAGHADAHADLRDVMAAALRGRVW